MEKTPEDFFSKDGRFSTAVPAHRSSKIASLPTLTSTCPISKQFREKGDGSWVCFGVKSRSIESKLEGLARK
jgi:hypothetical protein